MSVAQHARAFSEALGRTIRYRDVPVEPWTGKLREFGVPPHLASHLGVMARLHAQGRYDRATDDVFKLTGQKPMSTGEFVSKHAAEFTRG